MIVTGYYTLENKDNFDEIEVDGPFDCTHKGAWLGTGSYFWDTNIDWAHEWGDIGYRRRGKKYCITETKIDLSNNCFDLFGSVSSQQALMECIDLMIASGKLNNAKSAIIPNLIEFMKNQGIFTYSSIRAADMQRSIMRLRFRGDRPEFMVINQRVQICVIHRKGVLLHPVKVIFP